MKPQVIVIKIYDVRDLHLTKQVALLKHLQSEEKARENRAKQREYQRKYRARKKAGA